MNCDDIQIWEYAKLHEFTIITQDADFYDIGLVKGYPPKIIWLRSGSKTVKGIANMLRANYAMVEDFVNNSDQICFKIYE